MKKPDARAVNLILLLTAAVVFLLCLRFGSTPLQWRDVFSKNGPSALIIRAVRLPRALGACVGGAGLALSGVLLQSAVNNPLAGPNIIGVNAGAGLGMVTVMCFFSEAFYLQPIAAFSGALLCAAVISAIAHKSGGSRTAVVLAGVAISSLMNAGISALKLLYPDIAVSYMYFSVGGLSGVKMDKLLLPFCIIFFCFAAAFFMASRLELLCLGDDYAAALGIRIKPVRTAALLLASAAAGAAVSFCGLIGFVGLMVPHIARRLVGERLRAVLPASCLCAMILLMLSDLVGRVLFAPGELPAGMITAALGVPFFLTLLRRRAEI